MKSYITELTTEDFLNIEKEVMQVEKIDDKRTHIAKDKKNDSADVVFYEWIDDEEDKENEEGGFYAETRYEYRSFEPPYCFDILSTDNSDINERFFRWMIKRFGNQYIRDYFTYHTGVTIDERNDN